MLSLRLTQKIVWLLPRRVMYWAILRAYAVATQKNPTLTPDEITFELLMQPWEK